MYDYLKKVESFLGKGLTLFRAMAIVAAFASILGRGAMPALPRRTGKVSIGELMSAKIPQADHKMNDCNWCRKLLWVCQCSTQKPQGTEPRRIIELNLQNNIK